MNEKSDVAEIEEDAFEEKPFIKEEIDVPEYIDVTSFSKSHPKTDDVFYCPICPHKYKKSEYLSIHLAIHRKDMRCPVCLELFHSKTKFVRHLNGHIKDMIEEEKRASTVCSFCLKTFKTKKDVTIHLRVHTNERPYKCKICGNAFKQGSSLANHMVTHTKERKYICDVCNGGFTTSSSLRRHQKRIHAKGKTFDCKYCQAKFQNMADFRSHLTNEHRRLTFQRKCAHCSEVFHTRNTYLSHRKLYSLQGTRTKSEKKVGIAYTCGLCGEKCNGRKMYCEHRRSHLSYTKEEAKEAAKSKLFECKFCLASFKKNTSLFSHMAQHLENSHKCDLCGEFFTYVSLKFHTKNVHQVVNCKFCLQVIRKGQKLYHHYRKQHPNLVPAYTCNVCGKKCYTKVFFQRHVRAKHSANAVKNFKCGVCGRRFVSHSRLVLHKNQHVKKELPA